MSNRPRPRTPTNITTKARIGTVYHLMSEPAVCPALPRPTLRWARQTPHQAQEEGLLEDCEGLRVVVKNEHVML